MYASYRNGFLSIVQEETFEESDGERWITIDDLSDAVSTYFAHPVQNREINLLLKTARPLDWAHRRWAVTTEIVNTLNELTSEQLREITTYAKHSPSTRNVRPVLRSRLAREQ